MPPRFGRRVDAAVDDSKATPPSPSHHARITTYLSTPVSERHTDVPLILCCFVTGLCDSSAFAAWQCFVSMQTGNSIFLCLGAANLPINQPFGWAKSLISIAAFIVGSFCWAQTRRCGPTTRGTLSVSFFIQAILIILSAALVQSNVVPSTTPSVGSTSYLVSEGFIERVPVALLSFQSSAQLVTSQFLGISEVPTVVLTSVYSGLATDELFFKKRNVKRHRRVATIVSTFAGAIAGGWLSRSNAGIAGALWISAAVKMGIAIAWLLWKGGVEEEKEVGA